MKLYYSPTSPYVRKVTVAALECGLHDRIERITVNAWQSGDEFLAKNPLEKVPALEADDGDVLINSLVICEHLNEESGDKLIPAANRLAVLKLHALSDGILDAAVARIIEIRVRPEELRWPHWIERQKAKLGRALDRAESLCQSGALADPTTAGCPDLGSITLACGLGYLDFRFSEDHWRKERESLAAWYEAFAQRPSMEATVPAG
jgi:glutathione S-transferase